LFSAADVTLQLQASELADFNATLASTTASVNFVTRALAAGVDSISEGGDLALSSANALHLAKAMHASTQGLTLAAADALSITDGAQLLSREVVDSSALHTDLAALKAFANASDTSVVLTLPDIAALQLDNVPTLRAALQELQRDLANNGVDHLMITDDLANALAESDIEFLKATATQVAITVEAHADAGSSTAYLHGSLQDMRQIGVDQVVLDAGVQKVEVALRDKLVLDSSLTLSDLPRFQHNADQTISLVLDTDDLAALLHTSGAVAAFQAAGITNLQLGFEPASQEVTALQSALQGSSLHWTTDPLNPVEVALLGLGVAASDPTDPSYHNPFGLKHP